MGTMSFTHAAQSLKPGVAVAAFPRPEPNSRPPKFEPPTAYICRVKVGPVNTSKSYAVPYTVRIVWEDMALINGL